jgi:hypothetical protein
MTNPEGHFITSPSELMPTLYLRGTVIIFIVSEACVSLGMGRLRAQPFEVSETFSAP